MLSESYGWLPSQIESEKADVIERYIEIIRVKNLINRQKYGKK